MSEPPAPRCLCIVSRGPVRSGELLARLRTMVDTHEGLEIIVDRRRGNSDGVPDQLPADRRRQPSVDVRLKQDGLALVDTSPFLAGPPFVGVFAGRSIDELLAGPPPDEDEADPDDPELAPVLDFNRQRKARRRRRLALMLLVGSTLVLLLLTLALTMKALLSPIRLGAPMLEAPPPTESGSAGAVSPPAISPPLPPIDASPESTGSLRSPDPTSPAVMRTARPRAKPVGSPPMRRTIEPVHAAPAPKAMKSPEVAPPPSERAGEPGPAARAAGPAPQAATAAEVAAPRALIGPSTPPVSAVQSPESGRSPEAAPTGQAPTATIPDASAAPSGGSPSDRHVGGVGDQFKNLGKVMERDVTEATAEAKRQGDDFKALQNRFRRAWDGFKQGFVGPPEKGRE